MTITPFGVIFILFSKKGIICMENQTCQNCKYYRQHYGLDETGIFRVYCGHCTCARVKSKKPHQKACENFLLAENRESAFATKHYLSKTLLDWIRQLELLPEIRDTDTPQKDL